MTVDENRYFVNKTAPVALSEAPIIVNDTMYVPVDFFDGILGLRAVGTASGFFGISG
ncbi:stalk domain-containing protein [Paenibacillus cymbidii]|uniref:stalk domain-containing protein n=1 Tax=Paenibacillus cymbidii TaxID=1639034 RepID=UPI0022A8571E|nr:stalk domain-containing protein [Paenibacillus cymbidii]